MWYTVEINVIAHDEREVDKSKRKGGAGISFGFSPPLTPDCYDWKRIMSALTGSAEEEYEKQE